jgi:hypothetical protein
VQWLSYGLTDSLPDPLTIPTQHLKKVSNIPTKIKGEKLRNGLRQVFGPQARRISFRKSLALRGQAFVLFDSTEAAQAALEKAKGFKFYGAPLRVAFAHAPSDVTLKKQGKEPPKRPAHPKRGMVAVKLEQKAPTKTKKAAPMAVPVAQPFAPTTGGAGAGLHANGGAAQG